MEVENLNKVVKDLTAKGVVFDPEPHGSAAPRDSALNGYPTASLRDPDGNRVSLMEFPRHVREFATHPRRKVGIY
jgi:hypothetical protein